MGWVVNATSQPLYPPEKRRYPSYKKMGGRHGRTTRVRKISPPDGFDPCTVQPATSLYTDWAISAHGPERTAEYDKHHKTMDNKTSNRIQVCRMPRFNATRTRTHTHTHTHTNMNRMQSTVRILEVQTWNWILAQCLRPCLKLKSEFSFSVPKYEYSGARRFVASRFSTWALHSSILIYHQTIP